MEPEIETQKDDSLKQIRTFEGDIADTIKKQGESLVSIGRAERIRQESEPQVTQASGIGRRIVYIFLTLVLLALGGAGLYYAYGLYATKTAPSAAETPANQIVAAQVVTNIDASILSRQNMVSVLHDLRAHSREKNTTEQIEFRRGNLPTSDLLPTSDFLTRLASHAPNSLVRAFDNDFELIYWSTPTHGALVVKLKSYENAFPGMLAWEPEMPNDILPVFSDGLASGIWKDETLGDRDVRALKDGAGITHLLYGYFDNSMLIIVGNEDDFRLIVERLTSQKLSR